MSEARRPTPRQLNLMALNVLKDAARQARLQPIERTMAHRLALSWLVHSRVAKDWQADQFWKRLGKQHDLKDPSSQYCRDRDFTIEINCWQRNAKVPLDWNAYHSDPTA